MSSRFKEFRSWLLRFHNIGGLRSPAMAQVNTALWPTVTVVTLTFWSSGRVSRYTSVEDRNKNLSDRSTIFSYKKRAQFKFWESWTCRLSAVCKTFTVTELAWIKQEKQCSRFRNLMELSGCSRFSGINPQSFWLMQNYVLAKISLIMKQ